MSTFALLLLLTLGADHSGSLVTSDQKGGGHASQLVVTPPTAAHDAPKADSGGTASETAAPESVSESRRYTRFELATQAVEYANRQRYLQATVNPPNQVWNHLKNDHGFTADQVDGLTFNQALWVHSGAHAGVITAWTGKPAKMAVQIKPSGHWERRCVNGLCRMYWIAD